MTPGLAVFFDRDGTLIETDVKDGRPIARNDPTSVALVAGAVEICRELAAHGVMLFLVTNQPDVSRGKVTLSAVSEINELVSERCGLTAVESCTHDDVDDCRCRKPRPGMILDLASKYHLNLASSVMVGDRWRDVETGERAGCRTILINHGYDEGVACVPTWEVHSLVEAGLVLRGHFGIK